MRLLDAVVPKQITDTVIGITQEELEGGRAHDGRKDGRGVVAFV